MRQLPLRAPISKFGGLFNPAYRQVSSIPGPLACTRQNCKTKPREQESLELPHETGAWGTAQLDPVHTER